MDKHLTIEDAKAMMKKLSTDLKGTLHWGDDDAFTLEKLPLGMASLDAALNGGFAFDRIALIVGEFSTGKTLIAMMAIKAAQERGLSTAFIDVEKTWTPEWAAQLGIRPNDVLVLRAKTGEDAFNGALKLVKVKMPVIVIDSLAAMVAAKELAPDEDEVLQQQFMGGATASMIGRGLKLLNEENKGSLILCINQLREKPGVVYGNPETSPGGKAPGFYAWHTLRVRRGPFLEENGVKVGYHMKVVVTKNKQGAPFKEADISFYYTGEFDEITGLVEQAIDVGVIKQKAASYTFQRVDRETGELNDHKVIGRKKLVEAIKADPELRGWLETEVASSIERVDL